MFCYSYSVTSFFETLTDSFYYDDNKTVQCLIYLAPRYFCPLLLANTHQELPEKNQILVKTQNYSVQFHKR